jgi:hypothetical protein
LGKVPRMEPQPKVPQLCIAIHGRRRISFVYHGRERVAEPQCYGISTAGKEALRVFLIEGRSGQLEPLFTVAEMKDLTVLDKTFTRPGPKYKKGDSAMQHIFCEL